MSSILDDLSNSLSSILNSSKPKTFYIKNSAVQSANQTAISAFKNIAEIDMPIKYKLAKKLDKKEINPSNPLFDLLSEVLHVPVDGDKENTLFLSTLNLRTLLDDFNRRIDKGEDLQINWLHLFHAYLEASIGESNQPHFYSQLETLRKFLISTWPSIKNNTHQTLYELKDIDKYTTILEANACDFYSQVWLDGLSQRVIQMKKDLEIPQDSWFWENLFIKVLQTIVNFDDESFKKSLTSILLFLDTCPLHRDLGIQLTLQRFSKCTSTVMHPQLKDYIYQAWGSPLGVKHKDSNWMILDENSLKIAKSWHHETNLRIFYALKTGDKTNALQRLSFWLNFINQIEFSKLALGPVAQKIIQSQSSLQRIFNPLMNPFSKLSGDINPEQNAIIFKINNTTIVDFIINDGCYIYPPGTNTFDLSQETQYSTSYKGGLKERYGKFGVSIPENQDWSDVSNLKDILNKFNL